MAYLTAEELKSTYYKKAAGLEDQDKVAEALAQANAYAFGQIGGTPPAIPGDDGYSLKAAVATAFQYFIKGETGQANVDTGEITDVAPASQPVKEGGRDPLKIVDAMLAPYAAAFRAANTQKSNRGFMFL